MNFHLVEHLDKLGVAVVHDLAAADVQLGDLCHVLVTELEVPDVDVLLHALFVDRLGDDGDAPLDVPTQRPVADPMTGELIADAGAVISRELAERIGRSGADTVYLRASLP